MTTPETEHPAPAGDTNVEDFQGRVRTPPGRWWVAAFVGFAMILLWSVSYPGSSTLPNLVGYFGLFLLSLWWIVRLIVPMTKRRSLAAPTPWYRRWRVGPFMLGGLIVLVLMGVPVRVRFSMNKGDFDAVVRDLPPAGSFEHWERLEVPNRIGGYPIIVGYQVGPNVILYEAHGAGLFDDAGFAYLPDGPDERLGNGNFEAPVFRHLIGDWYAWQASW